MLTDFATLFAPNSARAGDQVSIDGAEAFVYSPQRLKDLGKGKRAGAVTRADIDHALRQRGGGVIVLQAANAITVAPIDGSGFQPPQHCLVLAPGSMGTFKSIKEINSRTLGYGEHVLVPVDQESEQKLRELQALLEYLPSDRALLIMNLIRRPSLELRVSELERRVGSTRPSRQPPSADFLQQWGGLKFGLVVTAVAVVVLVAVLWLTGPLKPWLGGSPPVKDDRTDPNRKRTEADTRVPSAEDAVTSDGTTRTEDASVLAGLEQYKAARRGLLQALRERSEGRLKVLYDSHYASPDSLLNDDTFMWTLLKTYLVKTNVLISGDPALSGLGQDQLDRVQELTTRNYAKLDSPERHLLAVASCEAWKSPRLPPHGDQAELSFASEPCRDVIETRSQAAKTLEGLTKWVQSIGTKR